MRGFGWLPPSLFLFLAGSAVVSACDRSDAWDVALMMLDEARESSFGHRVTGVTGASASSGRPGKVPPL